jgi:hypothetical protein
MPPRIPGSSVASSTSALVQIHSWTCASTMSAAAAGSTANFSTTASRDAATIARRAFRQWLKGPGANYERPNSEGGPNYLPPQRTSQAPPKNAPFPLNPQFRSTPVLDDKARELIWEKVMRKGEPIKAVSAELGVDITRVAAVVRLKEVERDWTAKVCMHLFFLVVPASFWACHFLHAFRDDIQLPKSISL